MRKIDQNVMARWVTLREGGKQSLPIGQVKEVQRLVLQYLSMFSLVSVWRLLRKVRRDG